jgi:hypothetical protein
MWSQNPEALAAWAREQRAAREAEAERYRTAARVGSASPGRWARTVQGVGGWMENTGRRLQARYETRYNTTERKETSHAAATRTQPV